MKNSTQLQFKPGTLYTSAPLEPFFIHSDFHATTIPGKRVETRSKFSPHPTFNVDNQVIFALFVRKNTRFSNID